MERKEFDCTYTESLVCPYCGHEHFDLYELHDDNETSCNNCEQEFAYEIEYDPTCKSWTMEEQIENEIEDSKRNLEAYRKKDDSEGIAYFEKELKKREEKLAKLLTNKKD